MSVLGILTRGYLGAEGGGVNPSIEIDLNPDILSKDLRPQIDAKGEEPPKFTVKVVEPEPEISAEDELAPSLGIRRVADPVPDAKPGEPEDEPSVKIRPVEDLVPEIVKKDD